MSYVLGKFEALSLLTFLTKIKQGRIQITDVKTHPPVCYDRIAIRDSRYIPKTIAVQVLGGYYFTCFHLSGSKSRYCPIGVFGGHAAHLSIMSQK